MRQELLTLRKQLGSPPGFGGVHVAHICILCFLVFFFVFVMCLASSTSSLSLGYGLSIRDCPFILLYFMILHTYSGYSEHSHYWICANHVRF